MIASGTLKYKLSFYHTIKTQSKFGDEVTSKELLFVSKAAKIKNTGNFIKDDKEMFHSRELIFKLRNNKLLKDDLIVIYENDEYVINFLDINNYDNSVQITIEKVNK